MADQEHTLLADARCSCGAEHDARGTGESGNSWFARHVAEWFARHVAERTTENARAELGKYLAAMDSAGGGIYTPDFRDGFRHALTMLDSYAERAEPGRVKPAVREAARQALALRNLPGSPTSKED